MCVEKLEKPGPGKADPQKERSSTVKTVENSAPEGWAVKKMRLKRGRRKEPGVSRRPYFFLVAAAFLCVCAGA